MLTILFLTMLENMRVVVTCAHKSGANDYCGQFAILQMLQMSWWLLLLIFSLTTVKIP